MDSGFEHNGKKYYIGVTQYHGEGIISIYDISKIKKIQPPFDKSEKELHRIELRESILDTLSNPEEINNCIVAQKIFPINNLSDLFKDFQKIKDELLKELP